MTAFRGSWCLLALLLSGCGGGSGGSEPTQVSASVNAGMDQEVTEKTDVTLNATGSPAGGTFNWQVVSGATVSEFPITDQQASFVAPDVKANVDLLIQVDYVAPDGSLASDQVMVSVKSNNQLPLVNITQTAPETLPATYQDTITLSGEGSSDPDENGQIVAYQWQQLSGPNTIQPSSLNNATLSFIHPLLDTAQTSVWKLTVTDDEGGQASNQFPVGLLANTPVVVANAGSDQQVQAFDTVTLDGSKSDTVSGQKQCSWRQIPATTTVSLSAPNDCVTSFIAPDKNVLSKAEFELTVTDSQNRTATDNVVVDIEKKPLGKLNDSGQLACYDNNTAIACNSDSFSGQDALRGRDYFATQVAKEGRGNAGFDFTKLNQFADELPDDATDFACIRDNVSGLIWEVKEASAGTLPNTSTRNAQNSYTWALSVDGTFAEGSVQSTANTSCPQDNHCGIQALIDEVNNPATGEQSYCGGNNWRLPTYMELLGLLDFSYANSAVIDQSLFPNLPASALLGHRYYWTTQSSLDGTGTALRRAYVIDMDTGNDFAVEKSSKAFVRLVRNP
ncbi:Lcl C-terminal domain-containing protein [Pseudoalteromonas peptidolytica]|uniref:Lcl C-terminal domain-containing protein n=1 Tax=Pseudoalteromonas peptidolytica F12-50-A1 TaxID=1315280 RepID=A0A8I0MSS8_9GAMM|nr:DUF1566 domain-containing protein [Pseudoalteromonas peptidolytica]MBE0345066.1 hypothetical protein [Pseudoalteromonas peptidolytica F12-50-A1]NLR14933.1 DUF1566 domain-containing protein [Pseudoalteromonas peptidolytica]GEK09398.1 hypothetical protein PPE03_16470 [Pseudoalteromonas peptidolytica]